jgi:hypothetical protein
MKVVFIEKREFDYYYLITIKSIENSLLTFLPSTFNFQLVFPGIFFSLGKAEKQKASFNLCLEMN